MTRKQDRDVRAIQRHKRRGTRWLRLSHWAQDRAERHVVAAMEASARLTVLPPREHELNLMNERTRR